MKPFVKKNQYKPEKGFKADCFDAGCWVLEIQCVGRDESLAFCIIYYRKKACEHFHDGAIFCPALSAQSWFLDGVEFFKYIFRSFEHHSWTAIMLDDLSTKTI